MNKWSRRQLLQSTAAAMLSSTAFAAGPPEKMIRKSIGSGNDSVPVIGLGTYSVFDVRSSTENIASRREIVEILTDAGGSVIDTSPMYNRSEAVIGDIIKSGLSRENLFLATKVWTDGKAAGRQQMERSAELMHTKVTDLMQVHNLRDLDTHMGTIREMKSEGLIRFDGITDYRASALDDLEAAMRRFRPDFIQINYSLLESQAELRLLPAARDLGVSVLVNRPFVAGRLFSAVSGHSMPDWATHYADSWAQFFLKWIVAHPAVTCVIPATSKSRHMHDNVMAGFGELPDANMRKKMKNFIMDL